MKYMISSGVEHEDLELLLSDSWMAVEIPDEVVADYERVRAEWERVQEALGVYCSIADRIRRERLCKGRIPLSYADDPKYAHWGPFKPQPCWTYVDDNGVCPKAGQAHRRRQSGRQRMIRISKSSAEALFEDPLYSAEYTPPRAETLRLGEGDLRLWNADGELRFTVVADLDPVRPKKRLRARLLPWWWWR